MNIPYKVVVRRTAVSTHTYAVDIDPSITVIEPECAARRIAELSAKTDSWSGRQQTCTFEALFSTTPKQEVPHENPYTRPS